MKIVVSGYVGKRITGIGRDLINLLENATGGTKFVIYTNEDMKDDFVLQNPKVTIKTYRVSKNKSFQNLLWTTFIFPFVVLKEKADRALLPNFTLLLFKFRPTFAFMHDLIEFYVPNKFSKIKMFYRTKLADPITAKRADWLFTTSENTKCDLVKILHIPQDKISVIYCGVDQSKFRRMENERAEAILTARGWPVDFLLYAGSIDHPGKNAMSVIKAFEGLKREGKYGGSLILAGMPGFGFEKVEEHILGSEYKSDIYVPGYVTDEELVALYSRCDVFCFPSLYEGFGIPPLEALACGAKVVVSNTSSLPEVVGDVGKFVDPDDLQMIMDAIFESLGESNDELHEKVLKQMEKFDWAKNGKEFENYMTDTKTGK